MSEDPAHNKLTSTPAEALRRLLEWPNPAGTIEKAYIPAWLAAECRATLTAGQQGEARPARAEVERLLVDYDEAQRSLSSAVIHGNNVHGALGAYSAARDQLLAALATQAAPEAQAEPAGEPVGTVKVIGLPDSTVLGTSTSYSQEALRRLGTGEHNLHAAHPSAAASGERDTLRALLREAREAIDALLKNIRRNAPELSGKTMGFAEQVAGRIDSALADGGAK